MLKIVLNSNGVNFNNGIYGLSNWFAVVLNSNGVNFNLSNKDYHEAGGRFKLQRSKF